MRNFLALISFLFFFSNFFEQIKNEQGNLYLTVAYCPTAFTGGGAVIQIDPETGDWKTVGTFDWPNEIFGCPADYDPSFSSDGISKTYLSFADEFGDVVVVDVVNAKIDSNIKISPHSDFFLGFTNFAVDGSGDSVLLKGVTPGVTQRGLCNDGCFEFGQLNVSNRIYHNLSNVYYKAMSDDVDSFFLSEQYYTQASHPLESTSPCSSSPVDQCLLNINGTTGETLSSNLLNTSIYQFGNSDSPSSVPAFIYDNTKGIGCDGYEYRIANLDLETGKILNYISCLSKKNEPVEEAWQSAFSLDNSLLAHASGSADTGEAQILVYQSNNGEVLSTTSGTEIAKSLGSYQNLLFVWAVDFFPS